jgi:uncharacterized membrane protein YqjE
MPPDATMAAGRSGGLLDSLKALGRTAVEAVHTRLDLLSTELKEEQARITELMVIAVLSLLCLFLAIVFVAFFVVVAVWDTPYRLWIIAGLAAALTVIAAGLWASFRRQITGRPRPFNATLEELSEDLERLR